AAADDIGTLVFDEIDSGISGRTAQRTAEKLCQLSAGRQILCITHLAQIAAMADAHLSIEKTVEGDATVTSVRTLKRDESVEALARLTGGAEITEKTLKAAGEMKQMAESLKHNFAIEKNARSV
ncbi:MAG: DNA repair protein RecN, partial [Defluviitaleaceae bacterium]|nr:DNA repair protein RecN [Defluviitaleaceae bacterium]